MRVRGIYSNLSINTSDDNDRHLRKTIWDMLKYAFENFKNGTIFLEELYYTAKDPASVKINTDADTTTSPYSGIAVTCLTDSDYNKLDSRYTITSVMYRVKMPSVNTTGLSGDTCNETLTINTPDGKLSAVATYYDTGTTFATADRTIVEFTVLNGLGKYRYANLLRIIYNHETLARRIYVYTYL